MAAPPATRYGATRAAVARSDGHAIVDRDSTRVSQVDLPFTFGLGLRWRPFPKLDLASQVIYRTWSGANSDLLAQGGTDDDTNIRCLCEPCHDEVTAEQFGHRRTVGVDASGWPKPTT